VSLSSIVGTVLAAGQATSLPINFRY